MTVQNKPINTDCKSFVNAEFFGYSIKTTVDAELAKYYLENYLKGQYSNTEFDKEINNIYENFKDKLPNAADLAKISQNTSMDFAALFFANKLLSLEQNRQIQKSFQKNLKSLKNNDTIAVNKDALIMLIPGYDYEKTGNLTGSNFATPLKAMLNVGYNVQFIRINPVGTVEENGEYISQEILKSHHKNIIIISASSASAAVYLCLGKLLLPAQLNHIKGWLNLAGVLQGVPVLEEYFRGVKGIFFSLYVWLKHLNKKGLLSMQTEISRERFKTLSLPKHIHIINYMGLSLSGNITKLAKKRYEMMSKFGPNDGLTLLPDIIAPNSQTVLAHKNDHFFAEDPEIDFKSLALLMTILSKIKEI